MSVFDTISRPYAKAIFDIAIQNNSIKEWKTILVVINMIASCKKVRKYLSGSLSPKYLSFIFISISKDLIDESAKNLIKLLAENQRLKILNNILEQFLKLEAHYNNIAIVELTTAFSLEKEQIKNIQKKVENLLLQRISIIYRIDSKILHGIIIKVNNITFDLSVQNRLKQLSNSLNF